MMRKAIAIALTLVVCAFLVLYSLFLYRIGVANGFRRLLDADFFCVERYNPENPDESSWNGYDLRILIETEDGQMYTHGVWQG